MFDTVDEIIAGFEQALELERELGTRYVEMPVAPPMAASQVPQAGSAPVHQVPVSSQVPQAGSVPVHQVPVSSQVPQAGSAPVPLVDKIERTGGHPPSPPPQLNRQSPITSHQSPVTGHQSPVTGRQSPVTGHRSPVTNHRESITDFAFIVPAMPQGGAADMLGKMVAAMGYEMSGVTVVTAATALADNPQARVYVVLGSDAFRTFAPGQRAALGMWTKVNDVPTIVTYSPARILSYFGTDAAGLTKAKRQIWSDLKSALARIGKKPGSV